MKVAAAARTNAAMTELGANAPAPLPLAAGEALPDAEAGSAASSAPVAGWAEEPPVTEPVDEAAPAEADEDADGLTAGQVRLNLGVVERLSVIAKRAVLAGLLSRRMYHQVLILPKSVQPTSSQKRFAFSTDGTPIPHVSPDVGQPVSVIQTGLPLAAAWDASSASVQRLTAFSMELLPLLLWK